MTCSKKSFENDKFCIKWMSFIGTEYHIVVKLRVLKLLVKGLPESFKIISPRHPDTTCELVASLINPETGCWDITTMKRIFLPPDMEVILSIPISPCLPEDT